MVRNTIFSDKLDSRQYVVLWSLFFLFVILSRSFNCLFWNPVYGGWITNIMSMLLFAWFFLKCKVDRKMHLNRIVKMLMLLPFFSVINSWILYDQSPVEGIKATMSNFSIWGVYFILHRYKVKEVVVLKFFLLVAVLMAAIQIIQQFTYPNAIFGVTPPDDVLENGIMEVAENRNGLWRFRMNCDGFYTMPILLMVWLQLKRHITLNRLLLVSVLLLSIYFTLTRQVMASALLAIFMSFFIGQKKINVKYLLFGLVCIIGLYVYYDELFGQLAEQASDEANDDNIRILAAEYYWNDSFRTPFTFLFGFGNAVSGAFLHYVESLTQIKHFFVTDVGAIGCIWRYGFVYTITVYYMLYKLFFRLKNIIPLYIRLMVVFAFPMSIMIFPAIVSYQYLVWACLLYICDLHISRSSLIMNIPKS
ncbi:MAG: hypothetical protein NC206_07540 [Bacteroides sp.]|nr:hypothetical protein [Roseburia sp.]MCM1346924.1 hypothetical protein [Bacteroides sp.]MCM1421455.1 hypothetical protein [Bacteroides sp.]